MSKTSSSNDNGRTLEYLITKDLSENRGCKLTKRAESDQLRDSLTAKNVSPSLLSSLKQAAPHASEWIMSELSVTTASDVVVDRAGDSDTGVADLVICSVQRELNLSIKLNHDALSHPRPYSLIKSIGFANTAFEVDHRKRMAALSDRFRASTSGADLYRDVPKQKMHLYKDTCEECASSLTTMRTESGLAPQLFNFLVGPGCRKLIVRTNSKSKTLESIVIDDYTKIAQPTNVNAHVAVRTESASLVLEFDNEWVIDLRIHTASSQISSSGQLALKFDAKRIQGLLPPSVVLL